MVQNLIVGAALRSDGADPAGWRRRARAAEDAGLSLLVITEPPGAPTSATAATSLDPIELASFLGATTSAIALVPASAATHAEPYHLSNRLSSLDWGTHGRAGWLTGVDVSSERARAYGASTPHDPEAEAAAVIDIVRRLWDSWEDGALIADTAAGRFLDNTKLHRTDLDSDPFRIHGPALMPRPIQGQIPVLVRGEALLAGSDVRLVHPEQAAPVSDAAAARTFVELSVTHGSAGRDLADVLRSWVDSSDGVLLISEAADQDAFLEVVSGAARILREDGILRPPRPGLTLREQLGLTRPESRYASAAAVQR